MSYLCITVHWLDDRYHGLLSRGGAPEWPPSPFRLFQALVAGVARSGRLETAAGTALEWLESLPEAPLIIAPRSCQGIAVTRYVPNNDGDKEPDRQKRLTGKTSHPTILLSSPEIHYLWPIIGDPPETSTTTEAARCLTCFGWGIDMAYGDARILDSEEVSKLEGIRWLPKPKMFREGGMLRVPIGGSMLDLVNSYKSALNRIEHGEPLRPVKKPQVFDHVFYANADHAIGPPCEVFALRTRNDEFDPYPHAKLMHIAGMTRCASIKAMKGFPPAGINGADEWVKSFVAGHRTDRQVEHKQFSYVPLPSIGHEHSDAAIRRVMIVAPFGCEAELLHLAGQLDGEQLKPEMGGVGPVLDRLRSDSVTRQYLGPSRVWASVSPVILPGHDDHRPEKTIKLIERALTQSGVEQTCRFTWSSLPNFAHCLTAHKYDHQGRRSGYFKPRYLDNLTAVHMRITFEQPVAGPMVIGSGRHCGFGVFAVSGD